MRLAFALNLLATALAVPLYVTRLHTADAVTVTNTYTTITHTHTAPTVEIFVSNGVTYTFTLTDCTQFEEPTTFTSTFIKKDQQQTTTTDDGAGTTSTTRETVTTLSPTKTQETVISTTEVAEPTTNTDLTELVGTTTSSHTSTDADANTKTAESTIGQAKDTTTSATVVPVTTTTGTTSSTSNDVVLTTNITTSPTTPTGTYTSPTDTIATKPADTTTSTPQVESKTETSSSSQTEKTTTATSSTSQDAATTTSATTPTLKLVQTNTNLYATTTAGATTTAAPVEETRTSTTTATTGLSFSTINSYGKVVPTAIVYSPYENDGTCKSHTTVFNDLSFIKSLGITKIRIYGTDCNSINTIEPNAASLGLKINQGFWIGPEGYSSITSAVDDLITWGKTNGWDVFDFITIGNEAVIANYLTADQLITIIADVKARLRAGGYNGLVTTSEPPVVFEKHPELCNDSDIDFVGINAHSYFDTYSTAESSGSFVLGQYNIVKDICKGKDILVTETGYPSVGIQNGGNVPSAANQKIAVEAILKEMQSKVTILSLFDDYWKQPGDYGIEQSFGTEQLYHN